MTVAQAKRRGTRPFADESAVGLRAIAANLNDILSSMSEATRLRVLAAIDRYEAAAEDAAPRPRDRRAADTMVRQHE